MTEWLDRALIASPYYYRLCINEKDFHRELKRLKISQEQWPPFITKDAATHFFEGGDRPLAIVTIGNAKGKSVPQLYAMLVHEAVHVWQDIKESLGEKSPSSEFEAYSIQALSQRLMESYERQRKVKK